MHHSEADGAAVRALLGFLDAHMEKDPGRIKPMDEAFWKEVERITAGVQVSDDDIIPDDVTL